jgi:autotransporter-associated beta strand protein
LNSNLIIQGPFYCTTTFNGPISGAGGLTINGDGPIVLAVANSYTGPTSVTACTLRCDNVDALGSGALSISSAANSKVNLNYSGTKNIAGLILGGIPQLGGTHGSTASDATNKNDTYFAGTGTVTVPASSAKDILTFSFGALGAATVNENTVTLEVPSGTDRTALAPTYTLSPGATGSPVSGTTLNFTGPQIYTITAQDLSTKQYTVTVIETVLPDIFTWASAVSGNWSVGANWTNELATGSSPLASGRPSYTLNFNAAGTYTATNNLSPTGFQLNVLNLAANVTLAGNPLAFVANGLTLPTINQNSGSAVTISNNLDLGANATYGGTGGGQVTLTGLISGAGSLTKNGSGTLRIDNINNSYAGGTIINSGTFFGGIDAKVGSGPITLNGGILYMWRFKPTNALTVNGGSITSENGFNQNQLNGPVTLNATLPINAPYQLTFSNTIGGTGGLTKTGNGLVILSNTCTGTYTGPTTVSAGTLRCDRPEALSGSSAISISGTGKMNLNYAGTKTVASLSLGGAAQTTPGTYGSVASGATFQSDTWFTTGSTGTLTIAGGSSFDSWSGGAAFDADANNDGVKNGLAWVLGAADKDANALGLLPLSNNTTDPTYFIFTYRRADAANTDSNTTIAVEYGSDLSGWTTATAGPNIIITPTDNFYGSSPGVDKVEVKINRSLAVGGKLFARLKVVKSP